MISTKSLEMQFCHKNKTFCAAMAPLNYIIDLLFSILLIEAH